MRYNLFNIISLVLILAQSYTFMQIAPKTPIYFGVILSIQWVTEFKGSKFKNSKFKVQCSKSKKSNFRGGAICRDAMNCIRIGDKAVFC